MKLLKVSDTSIINLNDIQSIRRKNNITIISFTMETYSQTTLEYDGKLGERVWKWFCDNSESISD